MPASCDCYLVRNNLGCSSNFVFPKLMASSTQTVHVRLRVMGALHRHYFEKPQLALELAQPAVA